MIGFHLCPSCFAYARLPGIAHYRAADRIDPTRMPRPCRRARQIFGRLAAVLGSPTMRISGLMGSVEAVRRKLRAVTSVVEDRSATEHEKANAAALKARLEQRLKDAGAPAGDWTDN